MDYEKSLRAAWDTFYQELEKAQRDANKTQKFIVTKLQFVVSEGLSVPARGSATIIHDLGVFVGYLGEGLVAVIALSKHIANAVNYLAQANLARAKAKHYIAEQLCPVLERIGDHLIDIGIKMSELKPKIPIIKQCAYVLGLYFKSCGLSMKGASMLARATTKLDAHYIAPALEKLTSGLVRCAGVLHSVAESVREVSQYVEHLCVSLAKKVNFKADSAANKQVDRYAALLQNKAKEFLFLQGSSATKPSPETSSPSNVNDGRQNRPSASIG